MYHDSYDPIEADALLYVGDGLFHPKALLLSQLKEIILWDPIAQKMSIIDQKDVQKQLDRSKANLKKFIAAQNIGIMVSTKPGQQYLKAAQELKKKLAEQGKKSYIFIEDTLKINQFENYNFIEAWVNTACPRIGTDDLVHIDQPLINLREAFDPVKALETFI